MVRPTRNMGPRTILQYGLGGTFATPIDYGETADITNEAYDDVADGGVLDEVARADHLHGMPSAGGGGGMDAGTSFSGSPSSGDLFFRTDRGLIYYYTGSQWLTANEYSQPLVLLDGPFAPQTSNGAIMYGPVDQGANGCWVTRHVVDVIQLAGDGSNYWTLQLQSRPASGAASNVGGTVVTNGYTNGNRVRTATTVGAAVNSAHADFMLNATETGSAASLYAMIVVYYRLIG